MCQNKFNEINEDAPKYVRPDADVMESEEAP
jgi:hypothetical protein